MTGDLDGAVMKALALQQYGPGLSSGFDQSEMLSDLSLWLILFSAPRVFFFRFFQFSLLLKNQHLIWKVSLRKHPFLLALRRWERFARRDVCDSAKEGTLRSNDADDNENVKKAIGLISKTTTSHVHHGFLYISFPFLHDS